MGKAIVAVDGCAAGEAAIGWTARIAERDGLDLEIICVVANAHLPPTVAQSQEASHRRALDAAAVRATSFAPSVRITSTIHHGSARDEILLASRTADLLVIGSSPASATTGLLHGTLTLQLAAATRCPLVVLPADWQPTNGHVIVGEDDDTDDAAIEFAAAEASRSGRQLRILRAWEIPAIVDLYLLGQGTVQTNAEKTNRELLRMRAARLRHDHPGLDVDELLVHGDAAKAISEAARGASMAVIGTHHRGALARMFVGSVAHDLLMRMHCPLAIIPTVESRDPAGLDGMDIAAV